MSLFQIDSDFQKVILIQTRVGYINYAGFLFLLDSYFSNAPPSCQLFPTFLGITMLPTSPINVLSFLHYCSGNFWHILNRFRHSGFITKNVNACKIFGLVPQWCWPSSWEKKKKVLLSSQHKNFTNSFWTRSSFLAYHMGKGKIIFLAILKM